MIIILSQHEMSSNKKAEKSDPDLDSLVDLNRLSLSHYQDISNQPIHLSLLSSTKTALQETRQGNTVYRMMHKALAA